MHKLTNVKKQSYYIKNDDSRGTADDCSPFGSDSHGKRKAAKTPEETRH